MGNILITGATGNVGQRVISMLIDQKIKLIAGVRNLERSRKMFGEISRRKMASLI